MDQERRPFRGIYRRLNTTNKGDMNLQNKYIKYTSKVKIRLQRVASNMIHLLKAQLFFKNSLVPSDFVFLTS